MENKSSSGGVGLPALVFLVFLVLKLTNVIAWSWWWVTAPLWIPAGIVIAKVIIYVILKIILAIIELISEKRR